MTNNKRIGNLGEQLAADFLIKNGYTVLERNYRTPYGELDIIAKDTDTVIFVEVKTRSSARFGTGFEAITAKKQSTLLKCAAHYAETNALDCPMRIDAVEIMLDTMQITHLKGAVE